MIGGQMNVNWQWIMLIDMFLAQMEDQLDILQQNPVYTVLNCLQVEIKVYDYDYDPETQTGGWKYDYTDYANGAEEILSYSGKHERHQCNCTDYRQQKFG